MENAFRNLQKMVQSVSGQDDLLGLECPAYTGMALKLLLLLLAARLWVPFAGFVQRCGLGTRGRSNRTPWKLSRAWLRWSQGGAAAPRVNCQQQS